MSFSLSRLLTASSLAALLAMPLAGQAATITVTEPTDAYDGAVCTLRNAISSINAGIDFGGCVATGAYGTDDTINLTAQTYVLSVDGPGEDNNQGGDLDIQVAMNIIGAGSGQTAISGSGFAQGEEDRVLHIIEVSQGGPAFIVNLQGLTIRDGNDVPNGWGGGLQVNVFDVEVNLTDVEVTANTSGEDGGGIVNTNNGHLTLINSSVHDNVVPDDAGGIDNSNGLLVLIDSTIDHNQAADSGGGIRNFGDLVAVNSTISRNVLTGAIAEGSGGIGGGLYNGGRFALINSTLSANTAGEAGGGIFTFTNIASGLDDNIGFLYNVTIARNDAGAGYGGGICADCLQTAVPAGQSFPVEVSNSLIAENTADVGPDCVGSIPFASGGFNLIGDSTSCDGFIGTGDQLDVPAGIGPLQNNGGPTETHALLVGSNAIDKGNNIEGCQAPNVEQLVNGSLILENLTEDQRHFVRPIAVLDPAQPICDVGAFEFQTFDYSVTKDDGLNNLPTTTGSNFTYTITVTNVGQGDVHNVTLNDPLPAGMTFVSAAPSQGTCAEAAGTVTCSLGDLLAGGSLTVGITVTATTAGTFTNTVTITNEGQNEEPLTRTATETTVVIGGGLVEGSGFHCALNPAAPASGAQGLIGFALLAALALAVRGLGAQRR